MLDLAKIRHFYFHPPPDDPEHESTPEELWAAAERQAVEECLLRGGDPEAEGLGEHGSLIGGPDKPARCFGFNPEKRLPRNPLPLSCFDHPRARAAPPATTENPDLFFAGLSASYLAGYPNRPHGAALSRIFRAADLTPVERDQLWHIFACIHPKNLVRLLARGGLSIYQVARAIHLSRARFGNVSAWINQFAARPESTDQSAQSPISV